MSTQKNVSHNAGRVIGNMRKCTVIVQSERKIVLRYANIVMVSQRRLGCSLSFGANVDAFSVSTVFGTYRVI